MGLIEVSVGPSYTMVRDVSRVHPWCLGYQVIYIPNVTCNAPRFSTRKMGACSGFRCENATWRVHQRNDNGIVYAACGHLIFTPERFQATRYYLLHVVGWSRGPRVQQFFTLPFFPSSLTTTCFRLTLFFFKRNVAPSSKHFSVCIKS